MSRLGWHLPRGQMLTVTPEAVVVIRSLVLGARRPPGAGLRIAQRDDHIALAMQIADVAEPGDTVLHQEDLAIFVGPRAALRLVDHTLDASCSASGQSLFLRDRSV